MTGDWNEKEIEKILLQLDAMSLPFKKYGFAKTEQGMMLLGTGGYANVYEACIRQKKTGGFAIKVIGFGDRIVNSSDFKEEADAQEKLCSMQENIVKVYDSVELRVWFDDDLCVRKAENAEDAKKSGEASEGGYLTLQFLVMEKVVQVLSTDSYGRKHLFPAELAAFEEQEIGKLVYDVGKALEYAHKNQVLHRDVKLENIFYDEKRKRYKLGDFGIAKKTEDGMASTTAFTKGYGAPEVVGAFDDKYDATADIYSFGMVLYVLLNGLKFPGSDTYHVNIGIQYEKGYQLSQPEHDYESLFLIAGKMCRFDPDERYQSMETVMNALDGIMINEKADYRKEHSNAFLTVGCIFLFLGMGALRISSLLTYDPMLNAAGWILLALAAEKGIRLFTGKDRILTNVGIFLVSCFLLISTGFSWGKLLLFFIILISDGNFTFWYAESILSIKLAGILGKTLKEEGTVISGEFRWLGICLLMLTALLFVQYFIVTTRNPGQTKKYYRKNDFWFAFSLLFEVILLNGLISILFNNPHAVSISFPGMGFYLFLSDVEKIKIGAFGAGFCILWRLREKWLMKRE